MKVTFINNTIGVSGFNPDRLPGDREGSWINHGLGSIATQTRDLGHDVDLIDLRQLSGWDDLKSRIQVNPAKVYALSVAPVDYLHSLNTVYHIKSTLPEAKIIVGGIHPSNFPQDYDFKAIDTVVIGEGEITFPKLLKNINRLPKMIKGERPDLDKLAWVDRSLFDYERELSCQFVPNQELPAISMLAGRGCPFKCAFCQPAESTVFGKTARMRSVSNVLSELVWLEHLYQFKSITFWDDTFTFNRKWVGEFCDSYEQIGFTQKITACSRADIICNNEDMIKRLAEIGLDWVVIGLESGSQRILDLLNKGTTVEQNYRAADICRKYGLKIFGSHMFGLPTETHEEVLATVKMIKDIAPEHPSPFWFNPIRGTKIYQYCQDNNLIMDTDRDINRTGIFVPALKGTDYPFIAEVMDKSGWWMGNKQLSEFIVDSKGKCHEPQMQR